MFNWLLEGDLCVCAMFSVTFPCEMGIRTESSPQVAYCMG